MKLLRLLPLTLPLLALTTGCQTDPNVAVEQKKRLAKQELMLAEMRSTMDEQGEVIVEQIKMMAEMQATIDKQRSAMRETSASLRQCSENM